MVPKEARDAYRCARRDVLMQPGASLVQAFRYYREMAGTPIADTERDWSRALNRPPPRGDWAGWRDELPLYTVAQPAVVLGAQLRTRLMYIPKHEYLPEHDVVAAVMKTHRLWPCSRNWAMLVPAVIHERRTWLLSGWRVPVERNAGDDHPDVPILFAKAKEAARALTAVLKQRKKMYRLGRDIGEVLVALRRERRVLNQLRPDASDCYTFRLWRVRLGRLLDDLSGTGLDWLGVRESLMEGLQAAGMPPMPEKLMRHVLATELSWLGGQDV